MQLSPPASTEPEDLVATKHGNVSSHLRIWVRIADFMSVRDGFGFSAVETFSFCFYTHTMVDTGFPHFLPVSLPPTGKEKARFTYAAMADAGRIPLLKIVKGGCL